jgi:uncharacterized membrane protein YbhN (UPF0104 family)
MLAPEPAISDIALPAFDFRALVRRAALPALLAAVAVAVAVLAGGRIHAFTDAMRRTLGLSPGWAALAVASECVSILGYIVLLSFVGGQASPRIGARVSAQITLAGTAATRLLPTAGAGGAALTLWTLRRSGLGARGATRTLLTFFVLLYAVFLAAIALAGGLLALHLVASHGPTALSAAPAAGAAIAVSLGLVFGARRRDEDSVAPNSDRRLLTRLGRAASLIGTAVRDACGLLRTGDVRLVGSVAYWGFDAGVLWATLHAFGTPPALPVIALAYFVGQLANTLPLPGSVSGGIAGVLIAFGVPADLALPAVLAYRAIAVWLPTPGALAAVPGLRTSLARWSREDNDGDAREVAAQTA